MKTTLFAFLLSAIPVVMGTTGPSDIGGQPVDNIPVVDAPNYYVLETLTIYNPTEGQCDSSPLITASNKRIDIENSAARKSGGWLCRRTC